MDIELQDSKVSGLLNLPLCSSMLPPFHLRQALQRSVLPPNLLLSVAVSLWPSFLRLHVVLLCHKLDVIPCEWQYVISLSFSSLPCALGLTLPGLFVLCSFIKDLKMSLRASVVMAALALVGVGSATGACWTFGF